MKTAVLKLESQDRQALVPKKWTVRQAAVHHQLDVDPGCQFWMFGDPHAVLQRRIAEQFSEGPNHKAKFDGLAASLGTSLSTHLIVCRWGTEGWPDLLSTLEDIIERLVSVIRLPMAFFYS
jgi:hypothetical protein